MRNEQVGSSRFTSKRLICTFVMRRCGACIIALWMRNAPYRMHEDGPFFCHMPPTSMFSFQCETFTVGDEEMYGAPPEPASRRPAQYNSFNRDLKTLGQFHNAVAESRKWQSLDLVRLSFHGWRHGAITNAFFLGMNELAITLVYRVRSIEVAKHYIAKKLGVLARYIISGGLAGSSAAAGADAIAQPSDLAELLVSLRSRVVVSSTFGNLL